MQEHGVEITQTRVHIAGIICISWSHMRKRILYSGMDLRILSAGQCQGDSCRTGRIETSGREAASTTSKPSSTSLKAPFYLLRPLHTELRYLGSHSGFVDVSG